MMFTARVTQKQQRPDAMVRPARRPAPRPTEPKPGGLLQRQLGNSLLAALDGAPLPEAANPPSRPGRPLDAATRSAMESRFGHDFGGVRVHDGPAAARSADMLDAVAYTVGQDVVLGADGYAPGTPAGLRILTHELAHVVQYGLQSQPAAGPRQLSLSSSGAAEREAHAAAEAVSLGRPVRVSERLAPDAVARQPKGSSSRFPPAAESLTKEQIYAIWRQSKDISEFRFRLLGPVTDEVFYEFLSRKGFNPSLSVPTLPEAGAHPQAVLAHSPYGKFWDQALIERYGGKNPAEAIANYRAKLATTTDKKAFGVAEYKAVYGVFRRLVAADPQASQASWEGTQLHHIEAKAADPVPNPERAVDPNNLLFTRGNARTQGTSHNAVTEGPTDTHPNVDEKSRMQWEAARRANPNSSRATSGSPEIATPEATPSPGVRAAAPESAPNPEAAVTPEAGGTSLKGGAAALAPAALTEAGRYYAQERLDEAARARLSYKGSPTKEQIEYQRSVGFDFTGKFASDGSPIWEYNPDLLQRLQNAYHFLFNPFTPLNPEGSFRWKGA